MLCPTESSSSFRKGFNSSPQIMRMQPPEPSEKIDFRSDDVGVRPERQSAARLKPVRLSTPAEKFGEELLKSAAWYAAGNGSAVPVHREWERLFSVAAAAQPEGEQDELEGVHSHTG